MPVDVFFDTSILIYAVTQDPRRSSIAEQLLISGGCVSVHVLNELVAVARRKLRMPWDQVRETTQLIRSLCEVPIPVTLDLHDHAAVISQRYQYHFYDSLVIASALASRCSTLFSEDMQNGQVIDSVRIRNPFRNP